MVVSLEEKMPEEVLDDLTPERILTHYIAAEANLLRLPLFALSTKTMKREGLECTGSTQRDGTKTKWKMTIRRPVGSIWPGPLSRAAHQAFLSIIKETMSNRQPFVNPVTFGWRDLCRRIGIVYSGRTVEHLKAAIKATKGLLIESDCAIYSKPLGKMIKTVDTAFNLYDQVAFKRSKQSGEIIEANGVWLSAWYLDNLNAYYTAPMDYKLWKELDATSQIASRLYEFLLLKFYSTDMYHIYYKNLARHLPVEIMKSFSESKRQFDPAFDLLVANKVIEKVVWTRKPKDNREIEDHVVDIYRGSLFSKEETTNVPEDDTSTIEVRELTNLKTPEWLLVADFYKLWANAKFPKPTGKELDQAKVLIKEHSEATMKLVLPFAIQSLRSSWPDCKTFGGLLKYIPEIVKAHDSKKRVAERQEVDRNRKQHEAEEHRASMQKEKEFRDKWTPVWNALPDVKKEGIKREIIRQKPMLRGLSNLLESECIKETARLDEAGELNTPVTQVVNQLAAQLDLFAKEPEKPPTVR